MMGITFGFAASVQPGPFQTFVISRALQNGWRSTLPVAFAPLLSDIPVICIVLLILTNIPVWIEGFLHLGGGLFVLFLAFGAFRSYKRFHLDAKELESTPQKNFFKAAMVNLLNPNVFIEWSLVMGPLLLKGWNEDHVSGISLLTGFYVTMVITLIGIIVLFATLRRLGPKVNRILIGISAVVLAGFGLYQIWLGIETFLMQ